MPRSLVLGNGHMLATFDEHLQMRDLYYPYVGMEDQTTYGHLHRVGFFIEGAFHWMDDGSWEISIDYIENSLVGYCTAINNDLQITVTFEDFVYTTSNVLFRKLSILNQADRKREIKVFFSHDLHLYGDKMQDTAQYEPKWNGVLHYRKNRYFLVSGEWDEKNGAGVDEYTVGKSEFQDKEGTWRDAEDGHLHENPIEQGSVDSTVGFTNTFEKKEQKVLYMWLIAAKKYEEIHLMVDRVSELTPKVILDHTRDYWQKWSQKEHFDFKGLPEEVLKLFTRSLLTIRTQADDGGAIIAANDSDIMKFNKDTYTYMWPRDGALVSMALSETGYEAMVRDFLFFCENIITKEGYVLHKYNPDGSVGSSWHPKIKDGEIHLPIQEDESALILVALQKYYEHFHNIEVVKKLFDGMVLRIGNWLMEFVDKKTGLPLYSYDLWEEHRGVFSYTASCTYGGLKAAELLATETGHVSDAKKFAKAAKKMQKAICEHLYCKKEKRFYKRVLIKNGKIIEKDSTVDASLAFVWKMGVLPVKDERIQNTMEAIKKHLIVPGEVGGIARYQTDFYQFDYKNLSHNDLPGNPWIITTLWLAEYEMLTAQSREDLEKPLEKLLWVTNQASSAGMLPEQMHPVTGEPLSVAPLTWSHSTFVSSVMLFSERWKNLGKCKVVIECD